MFEAFSVGDGYRYTEYGFGRKYSRNDARFICKKLVETDTGEFQSGVFSVFDPAFEVKLSDDMLQASDIVHAQFANEQLYESIQRTPALAEKLGFTAYDIENLRSFGTPTGYEWHHHEEIGLIQLVDQEVHQQTGYTGGRAIWDGGTDAR